MPTKTSIDCQQHYLNYYFGGIFEKTHKLTNDFNFTNNVSYLYKMKSLDPPRFDLDNVNFKRMAGYRCARGEFDTPFDPSAEMLISNVDLTMSDDLNCAVFRAYNNRLM